MGRSTISVYAEVNVDEVLDDVGEKRLVEAVKDRGYIVTKHEPVKPLPDADVLAEILEAIQARRYGDAVMIIERAQHPKWKTADECAAEYEHRRRVQPNENSSTP